MPFELLRFEMLLPAFGLVLARVAGLVFAVPMFSSRQIPRIVKVWLTVTISLMTLPATWAAKKMRPAPMPMISPMMNSLAMPAAACPRESDLGR